MENDIKEQEIYHDGNEGINVCELPHALPLTPQFQATLSLTRSVGESKDSVSFWNGDFKNSRQHKPATLCDP